MNVFVTSHHVGPSPNQVEVAERLALGTSQGIELALNLSGDRGRVLRLAEEGPERADVGGGLGDVFRKEHLDRHVLAEPFHVFSAILLLVRENRDREIATRIVSMRGFLVPPTTRLRSRASFGWTQNRVTPTTRSPAPSAKRVSVVEGVKLTTRFAAAMDSNSILPMGGRERRFFGGFRTSRLAY